MKKNANKKIENTYKMFKELMKKGLTNDGLLPDLNFDCKMELETLRATYNFADKVYEENGLRGIKDIDGNILVPAQFTMFFSDRKSFYEHHSVLLAVDKHNEIVLVATDGKGTILDSDISEDDTINFYTYSLDGKKFGVCDLERGTITDPVLDGYHLIKNDFIVVDCGDKRGLLTSWGLYVDAVFDEIGEKDDCVYVRKGNQRGYISYDGEFVDETDKDAVNSSLLLNYEPFI